MAWIKNGTPHTLVSSADELSIPILTAKKFNVLLSHLLGTGAVDIDTNFNDNSNAVYAQRSSSDGGADATATGGTYIDKGTSGTTVFDVMYGCSISAEEKLIIGFLVNQSTAGAGTAPSRIEYVAKFVPSPDVAITRIDDDNTGGTNAYDTSSNLSALGTD